MKILTPSLNTAGAFKLKAPWDTIPNTEYVCTAIATIPSLLEQEVDVLKTIYKPMTLTEADYLEDVSNNVPILTLTSATAPTIKVPSSYLLEYPDISIIPYSHIVLSVSLGAIADSTNLEHVKDVIGVEVESTFGITPNVLVHRAPSTGTITPEQHANIETNRLAAVTTTTTDRARVLELTDIVTEQRTYIKLLEDAIINNA